MKRHRTEQFPNLGAERGQLTRPGGGEVAAVKGEIEARVGFCMFTVAIGQLGNEVRLMAALGPSCHALATRQELTANP
jgi:hypothetical protein